jgi:hypothetical protein
VPGWSLAGADDGGDRPPTPIGPPPLGMIFWVKGDVDLVPPAGDFESWADQGGQSQDLNLTGAIKPQTGADDIDGIPALTFPAEDDSVYASRNTAMKDRNGDPMPYTHARTIMAVFRPTRQFAVDRIGGPVFSTADQPNFECLFQVENWFTFDKAMFIFDNLWSFSGYQRLGPVTTLEEWEDVATLGEWRSSGFPEIAFAVNGTEQPLQTPGSIPTTTQAGAEAAAAGSTFAVGNCWNNTGNLIAANFHGSICEVIMWDYDLSTNPIALAQARAYFAGRYPSIPVAV